MICAHCGKPIEERHSDTLKRMVLVHSRPRHQGTKFCYERGPAYASMPVIVEDFDPTDAMRDASHDAYDATCATRDT